MANLYTRYGMDFANVFRAGSGKQYLNIFTDTGMDVGQCYEAGTSAFVSGFSIADGRDLRQVLASSNASTFAAVSRTPDGWENIVSSDRWYAEDQLPTWHENFKGFMYDESRFVALGDTDWWSSRVPKYMSGCKFYRVRARQGAPAITGIRVTLDFTDLKKAGITTYYVEKMADNLFGFILCSYSRTNGYARAVMRIYAQTVYGEYVAHTATVTME